MIFCNKNDNDQTEWGLKRNTYSSYAENDIELILELAATVTGNNVNKLCQIS